MKILGAPAERHPVRPLIDVFGIYSLSLSKLLEANVPACSDDIISFPYPSGTWNISESNPSQTMEHGDVRFEAF
jgi:hypothetical protein